MRLTEHFTLAEMVRSRTAKAKGIPNEPDEDHIDALKDLCVHVLEPLRDHMERPIKVNSGYRSPDLCEAIGSSRNSRHTLGQAADIVFLGTNGERCDKHEQSSLLGEAAAWLLDEHQRFDGMVLEAPRQQGIQWLHLSYDSPPKCRVSFYLGQGRYIPLPRSGLTEQFPGYVCTEFAELRPGGRKPKEVIDEFEDSLKIHAETDS